MKNSHEIVSRAPRKTLSASFALLGAFAVLAAGTAQAADRTDAKGCHEETKRVAVWPKGPKAAQRITRFEERVLTICDGKVTSRRSKDEARLANENGE